MLAFPGMLVPAAKQANMKVPPNPEEFPSDEFPHFAVFCNAQLARPMSSSTEHWSNAKVIAAVPEDQIRTVCLDDLIERGLTVVL